MSLIESRESPKDLLEGDFENPEQAAKLLVRHLKQVIKHVTQNGIESPADIGMIARSLEVVCYATPVIPSDEPEYQAASMFEDAFVGEWECDATMDALTNGRRDELHAWRESRPSRTPKSQATDEVVS
jgi:hypothetical protein